MRPNERFRNARSTFRAVREPASATGAGVGGGAGVVIGVRIGDGSGEVAAVRDDYTSAAGGP